MPPLTFTGISPSEALVAAAVAAGVVVGLYLLRVRRRVLEVPFSYLWSVALEQARTTRLFSQLRRILSLVLSLLIVASISFARTGPIFGSRESTRMELVLIDVSASMQARDSHGRTRLEQALDAARAHISRAERGTRMSIAAVGPEVTPLCPFTSDSAELLRSISSLQAGHRTFEFEEALHFAYDALPEGGSVVLISDGGQSVPEATILARIRAKDIELRWIRIGERASNVSILSFGARRHPIDRSRIELLLTVANRSRDARDLEVELLGDGEALDVLRFHLEAQQEEQRSLTTFAGARQALEARVLSTGAADALEVDDRAYARLPARARTRVMLVTESDVYLTAALLLDPALEVTEVAPSDYASLRDQRFDVAIFEAFAPPSPFPGPVLWIAPPPREQGGPFAQDGEILRPSFERLDRDAPLLRFATLRDVNIARTPRLILTAEDTALASDARAPLLVRGAREGHPFIALAFDPRQSDLPLRVAFPVLLLGAIDALGPEADAPLGSIRLGQPLEFRLPASSREARVRDPRGVVLSTTRIAPGRVRAFPIAPGFHQVESLDGQVLDRVAVNIDSTREGQLEVPNALDGFAEVQDRASSAAPRVGDDRSFWPSLIALVFLLLVLEFFTFHRRQTV